MINPVNRRSLAIYAALATCLALCFLAGCQEYNPIATRVESDSLSGVVQLTHGYTSAGEASFSRDMRWIVYQAIPRDEAGYQIYVAKVITDGTGIVGLEHPIRITPARSRNASGAISPDGNSIIFASTANPETGEPTTQMRIFRADIWENHVAMTNSAVGINLAQHPLTADDCLDCAYSPDGRWIVYTGRHGSDANLFAMHADGSHVIRLTTYTGIDGGPSFSPDGKSILFRSDRDGKHQPQIFLSDLTFDPAGEITGLTRERRLTHDEFINHGPRWHPDGQHIIYSTSRLGPGNRELFIMNKSGNEKTRITFFVGADLLPNFSPDGKWLLWTSRRSPDASLQLFLAGFTFPRGS